MNKEDGQELNKFKNCLMSLNNQYLIEKSMRYKYDFKNDKPLRDKLLVITSSNDVYNVVRKEL